MEINAAVRLRSIPLLAYFPQGGGKVWEHTPLDKRKDFLKKNPHRKDLDLYSPAKEEFIPIKNDMPHKPPVKPTEPAKPEEPNKPQKPNEPNKPSSNWKPGIERRLNERD